MQCVARRGAVPRSGAARRGVVRSGAMRGGDYSLPDGFLACPFNDFVLSDLPRVIARQARDLRELESLGQVQRQLVVAESVIQNLESELRRTGAGVSPFEG